MGIYLKGKGYDYISCDKCKVESRLIKKVSHQTFLDLAVVFYLLIEGSTEGMMYAMIKNELIDQGNC
jgi:hypothetical protein